ncbi:acyltransferase family protein [Paraburkholderia bryophila]|uniref:Peptidoglycan/LPS O-acetylase OafA/YrhL n=1 Tax=Paraburkholderia bryophila TaxID=420952 RepID=A0A329CQE8_9BURK|nr:acyltransferase [Paraburkholderia bryophila]RAS35871.1 peptidoglycan/LPS O-acetylase OafA/YrhL [Paraburkholderia bryophila]
MSTINAGDAKHQVVEDLKPLTSLRFVAAMMIVILHAKAYFTWPWLKDAVWPLDHGVSFFFVLSGFILTHVYASKSFPGYIAFIRARIARLWPVHVFTLLATVIFIRADRLVLDGPGIFNKWLELASNLSLTHAAMPFDAYVFSWNSVSWSISTEAFFYLAFPMLLINIRHTWLCKLLGSALIALGVVAVMKMFGVPPDGGRFQVSLRSGLYAFPLVRAFEFCLGMSTWVLWDRYIRHLRMSALAWTVLELAMLTIIARWFGNEFYVVADHIRLATLYTLFGQSGSAWLIAPLIAVLAAGRGAIGKALSWRPFVYLGEISFSIYMLHQILMKFFSWDVLPEIATPVMYFCALIFLAAASHALIEVPCRKRILQQKSRISLSPRSIP